MSATNAMMTVVEVVFGGGASGLAINRLVDRFFDRDSRRADATAKLVETELSKQKAADDRRDAIQQDLVAASKRSEQRAERCELRCNGLQYELDAVREGMTTLLENLDDKIIPLLDPEVRTEARRIMADARIALRHKLIGES